MASLPHGYFSHIGVTYSRGISSIFINGSLSTSQKEVRFYTMLIQQIDWLTFHGAPMQGAQDNNPETLVLMVYQRIILMIFAQYNVLIDCVCHFE